MNERMASPRTVPAGMPPPVTIARVAMSGMMTANCASSDTKASHFVAASGAPSAPVARIASAVRYCTPLRSVGAALLITAQSASVMPLRCISHWSQASSWPQALPSFFVKPCIMVAANAPRSPSVQAFMSESFITLPATRPVRLCVMWSPVQRFSVLVSASPITPCACRKSRCSRLNCRPKLASIEK